MRFSRLAYNATIVSPNASGLGVYAASLLMELCKLRPDNLIAYTSYPAGCKMPPRNIRSITDRVQPDRGRTGHYARMLWLQTMLPLRLLHDRADRLFSPLPEAMMFPIVPQIVVVHDLIPLHFPEEHAGQKKFYRFVVPWILRRSVAVIAVSQNTRRDFLAHYALSPEKISVVPNGYDPARFHEGIPSDAVRRKYGLDSYLLYVGNLLPHKNLARVLTAFARVPLPRHVQLLIVGKKDARYFPALFRKVNELGVADRVVFFDYGSLDELPALYSGAQALVFPSLYEGFGLPVLEAMACGTPVITSTAGSLPEVAGDAALLVDPYRVEAISDAMYTVLSDSDAREELRHKGLKRVKAFGWEKTARGVLQVVEQCRA